MTMENTTFANRVLPAAAVAKGPMLRFEFGGWDPPQSSMPYTSLLDDVARTADAMTERANREWAAGFPARAKAGQSLAGRGFGGSRVSPLNMPEQLRGRMVAASI